MAVIAFDPKPQTEKLSVVAPAKRDSNVAGAARGLVTASLLSLVLWLTLLIAAISLF